MCMCVKKLNLGALFFFDRLNGEGVGIRACRRPQKKTGGVVGLCATSPRCGRASLAAGFSLLSLTLAYASVTYTQYGLLL